MSALAIELTEITKNFGNVCANKDVSLKVESGTIHGIIGENGAGKSTTLKTFLGLMKAAKFFRTVPRNYYLFFSISC